MFLPKRRDFFEVQGITIHNNALFTTALHEVKTGYVAYPTGTRIVISASHFHAVPPK
jgi:hypothetical protein